MCTEFMTKIIYSGGGCKMGLCDKPTYFEYPCPKKPVRGVRHCEDYKIVPFGSSRQRGPRPDHEHTAAGAPNGHTEATESDD